MIRAEIAEILQGGVRVKFPNTPTSTAQKIYQYPKGVTPALADKIYLEKAGDEYIIVLVQGGS